MVAINPRLPVEMTSFVGRVHELAEVKHKAVTSRLLTICGTAGCGKTRLALQAAKALQPAFPDGIIWIELAPITDPFLVARAVAKKLEVPDQQGQPFIDAIASKLLGKTVLLVLDNCEHLIEACAHLVRDMMGLPGLHLLATSREVLDIPGEEIYPLQPMAVPPTNLLIDEIAEYDVLRLFKERARLLIPTFDLNPHNITFVASICRRLDGLPLAVELASARINILTVEQIDARLDNWIGLLGRGPSTSVNPHPSLRAALNWSYDLLTQSEQTLLRRLSVFSGGCSLSALETICAGGGVEVGRILDLLSVLVSKSLLVAETILPGEARYRLLETVRQYAREQLIASGEYAAIRSRHFDFYLAQAENVAPKLSGSYQRVWLHWLEGEYDNIRACFAWALESSQIEAGLRIGLSIYPFWTIRDYAEEGLLWLERLLAQADSSLSPVVHANALAYAVFLAGFRANVPVQILYGQRAAEMAAVLGDKNHMALRWALAAQAHAAQVNGDLSKQIELGRKVIQINRELGDRRQLGLTLSIYSFTAMSLGLLQEAQEMLEEALPILREDGNPYRIAMALNFYGDLARCQRDFPRAQAVYQESISLLRQIDAPRDLASGLQNLGHTYLHLGKITHAQRMFDESLTIQLAQHNPPGVAECLIGFTALAVQLGLPGDGAHLLAAALKQGGKRLVSAWAATRIEYELVLSQLGLMLAEEEFDVKSAEGSRFSLDQAVDLARKIALLPVDHLMDTPRSDNLTSREQDVASLISLGLSNAEIAQKLVLSKRTVEKHIAHILMKLELTNRAQVVRWVIETKPSNTLQPR